MISLIEQYLDNLLESEIPENFIRQKVYQIVSEYTMTNIKQINDSTRLVTDLNMDNDDKLEILMSIEEEFYFPKNLSDKVAYGWKTIGDIIKTVKNQAINKEDYKKQEQEYEKGSIFSSGWKKETSIKRPPNKETQTIKIGNYQVPFRFEPAEAKTTELVKRFEGIINKLIPLMLTHALNEVHKSYKGRFKNVTGNDLFPKFVTIYLKSQSVGVTFGCRKWPDASIHVEVNLQTKKVLVSIDT